ncbi:MAG: hypothetical protein K9H65_06445 [Bacteroidales bacterium]|nr:hypothetical protein [Bacteroidales bacterium]
MYFEESYIYHIYNMGNHKDLLFFEDENYRFFLKKIKTFIQPVSDILAYCLMPNHFHLMIRANTRSIETITSRFSQNEDCKIQKLARKLGTLQSSYTQAINKKYNWRGSLFRQKTKCKNLSDPTPVNQFYPQYPFICFQYIHQNPFKAGLVRKMEDWPYSSFREYLYNRRNSLCNIDMAKEILPLDPEYFYEQSYILVNTDGLDIF